MLVLEQPAENQETGTEKSTLNLELLKGKTLEELENIECCESIVQTYSAQLCGLVVLTRWLDSPAASRPQKVAGGQSTDCVEASRCGRVRRVHGRHLSHSPHFSRSRQRPGSQPDPKLPNLESSVHRLRLTIATMARPPTPNRRCGWRMLWRRVKSRADQPGQGEDTDQQALLEGEGGEEDQLVESVTASQSVNNVNLSIIPIDSTMSS